MQTLEERLWDYIDGGKDEQLETLLAGDREARELYDQLLAVHAALQETEEPSMRFAKNVMDAVARQNIAPATSTYINKRLIRVIALILLAPIAILTVYALSQVGGGPAMSLHLPSFTMPSMHINPYLTIGFVFVAVVAGFMALDAFLQSRKA